MGEKVLIAVAVRLFFVSIFKSLLSIINEIAPTCAD